MRRNWYETGGGNFITSTYYMPPRRRRGWQSWNNRRFADQYFGKSWTRLLSDTGALYERYAGADAVEGERDRKDIVFPHAIRGESRRNAAFYDDLRRTPYAV